MNPTTKKLAALASTAVLVLGAAACGGNGDGNGDATSSDSSKASASATPAAASGGADAKQAAFFTTLTEAQTKARSSHVTMKIGAAGQDITAEGDVAIGDSPADTAMSMTMDTGSGGLGSISMVLVDNTLYMNLGQVTGGKYGTIDLDDTSNPLVEQFGSLTEQLDPAKQLDQFKAALTSLQKKGDPETIDGVQAQPYELTLDTSRIAGLSGSAAGASVPKSLTYTMYVGPDDLLRRVEADVAGSTVTADYTRWGEPVDVEAPPADQVSATALDKLGAS